MRGATALGERALRKGSLRERALPETGVLVPNANLIAMELSTVGDCSAMVPPPT